MAKRRKPSWKLKQKQIRLRNRSNQIALDNAFTSKSVNAQEEYQDYRSSSSVTPTSEKERLRNEKRAKAITGHKFSISSALGNRIPDKARRRKNAEQEFLDMLRHTKKLKRHIKKYKSKGLGDKAAKLEAHLLLFQSRMQSILTGLEQEERTIDLGKRIRGNYSDHSETGKSQYWKEKGNTKLGKTNLLPKHKDYPVKQVKPSE